MDRAQQPALLENVGPHGLLGAGALAGDDEQFELRVPVLGPAWSPAAPRPSTFTAQIDLADGQVVVRSLPPGIPDPSCAPGQTPPHLIELPAVPTQIFLDVRQTDPLATLETVAEVGTLLIMITAGVIGWRRLRRNRS